MGEEAATSSGRLAWELVDLSSGQVREGQREVRVSDLEVMVLPPPVRPRFDRLLVRPGRVVADSLGWLVKGGRGSSTKAVRLGHGFWLVLRERRSPSRSTVVFLTARCDDLRLSGGELFRVDEGGTTATRTDEPGMLGLEWDRDQEGFSELARMTAVTDVSLKLQAARGPIGRDPVWEVRILAGSSVRWPRAADGVRLAPRLRPDRQRPGSTP